MSFRRIAAGCALAAILGTGQTALAGEARSEQVPNGQKLDCGLCHVASGGGGPRNPFGEQIEAMGLDGVGELEFQGVVWANLWDLDADGDGFTNGVELGDPDGTWVPTDGDPAVFPALPGDPDSTPCPNGSVHVGEDCDGDDLAGQTCLGLGFTGGMLACNTDCTFDTSGCMQAEFPDLGGGPADMGEMMSDDPPSMVPDLGTPVPSADMGDESGGNADVGGCSGPLEIRNPDAGADASLLLLLLLWRRRT